jgi:hypothetical protein
MSTIEMSTIEANRASSSCQTGWPSAPRRRNHEVYLRGVDGYFSVPYSGHGWLSLRRYDESRPPQV